MKLLLDTHALVWFALDDKRLSAKAESLEEAIRLAAAQVRAAGFQATKVEMDALV